MALILTLSVLTESHQVYFQMWLFNKEQYLLWCYSTSILFSERDPKKLTAPGLKEPTDLNRFMHRCTTFDLVSCTSASKRAREQTGAGPPAHTLDRINPSLHQYNTFPQHHFCPLQYKCHEAIGNIMFYFSEALYLPRSIHTRARSTAAAAVCTHRLAAK